MATYRLDPSECLDIQLRIDRQGDGLIRVFDSAGAAVDLAGTDWQLFLKRQPGANTNILNLTIGNGLTIGGVDNNEVTIDISSDISTIAPGTYYYEVYRVDLEKTWLHGNAYVVNGKYCG